MSAEPQWWTDRGVKNGGSPNDYVLPNQGQAKWFALKAEEELCAKLPEGFRSPILGTLPSGNNYVPINQGQWKNLIKPLYDRIQQVIDSLPAGVLKDAYGDARPQGKNGGTYPWTVTTDDDQSYAPVNIGQLKYALSFDLSHVPTVTVLATDPMASEVGLETGTFTITRTGGDQTTAMTVTFNQDNTDTNKATPGVDYELRDGSGQLISNQVTIPANQSSATVVVHPLSDTLVEGTETAKLNLQSGTDYTVGTPNTATISILDTP